MRLPHIATVERLQEVGGKYMFTSAGSVRCFLQPVSETSAQLFGINWAKGSVVYAEIDADIKESDRLTINGSKFGVRGVAPRPYGSKRVRHIKAVVEEL